MSERNIKVRDSIMHAGHEFTIINISLFETPDGMRLNIDAVDLQIANKEETKKNEMEDMTDKMMSMMRKLFEGGSPGGL